MPLMTKHTAVNKKRRHQQIHMLLEPLLLSFPVFIFHFSSIATSHRFSIDINTESRNNGGRSYRTVEDGCSRPFDARRERRPQNRLLEMAIAWWSWPPDMALSGKRWRKWEMASVRGGQVLPWSSHGTFKCPKLNPRSIRTDLHLGSSGSANRKDSFASSREWLAVLL